MSSTLRIAKRKPFTRKKSGMTAAERQRIINDTIRNISAADVAVPRSFSRVTVFSNSGKEIKAVVTSYQTKAPGGGGLNCNQAGSIIPLNLISAGSSFYNRVGRKIGMKSLMLEININPGVVARSAPADTLRILVIYDKQTNGSTPVMSDFLMDTEADGTNTTNALSNINLNNRERFDILRDWRIGLPAMTDQVSGVPTLAFPSQYSGADGVEGGKIKAYIKLGNRTTQYKADSAPAVIGDIATGALWLVTVAGSAAGAEVHSIAQWSTRLRYFDQ